MVVNETGLCQGGGFAGSKFGLFAGQPVLIFLQGLCLDGKRTSK
ncbi:hypothetical protein [Lucifera butyrica]|nr:hypothetical protein [Lucifera butyrica]